MAEFLSSRVLYQSPLVRVGDVRCRAGRCGRGGEEASERHSIAVARRGVFVKHVGGQAVTADANTVMFFQAGREYRVSHPGDCGDDCTTLAPSPEVLRDAISRVDPGAAEDPRRPFAFTHAPVAPRWFLAQSRLVRDAARYRSGEFEIDELVFDLLDGLLGGAYRARGQRPVREHRGAATRRAHRDTAEAVKAHLGAHGGGRLELADLARGVHTSPYHLSRLFREETGTTISGYLLRLRVRRAMSELAEGGHDLSRVAVIAGFYDHSHLTNAFRREFGLPPAGFRDGRDASGTMSNGVQA